MDGEPSHFADSIKLTIACVAFGRLVVATPTAVKALWSSDNDDRRD
jgi:hypothetical protein